MFRRININVVLLIILALQIIFLVKNVTEEKARLGEMGRNVITSATMTEVEKTEDNTKLFTESELSEEYEKKTMYRLDIVIDNQWTDPIELDFDFSYIRVKTSDGDYFDCEKDWYYSDMDDMDRPYCEMIPAGTAATVSYYVLVGEEEFSEIRVYPWSGREEYIVVEMK